VLLSQCNICSSAGVCTHCPSAALLGVISLAVSPKMWRSTRENVVSTAIPMLWAQQYICTHFTPSLLWTALEEEEVVLTHSPNASTVGVQWG